MAAFLHTQVWLVATPNYNPYLYNISRFSQIIRRLNSQSVRNRRNKQEENRIGCAHDYIRIKIVSSRTQQITCSIKKTNLQVFSKTESSRDVPAAYFSGSHVVQCPPSSWFDLRTRW